MSHELTINAQGQAEMFSGSGITPWHKLGTILPGLATAREALEAARLAWQVLFKPVVVEGETVADYRATVRGDNGKVLSIVGNRYEIIQNQDCFDFFDSVIGEGQAVYDTAGSLYGGRKVWIMAKLKGSLFLKNRPGDVTEKNVLLCTSHDGTSGLSMQIVATRVVCQNTLSMALAGATNTIKIRHTKSYEAKKETAMETLGLCNAYFGNLQAVMNELDNQAMNQDGMEKFTEKLIPAKDGEETTRALNIRTEINSLFTRGKGNLGKSRWDALNAVTEYVDHARATRTKEGGNETENRFVSSLMGSGNVLKSKALALLTA